MGRLITRYFAREHEIIVCDRSASPKEIRALGARSATLQEACRQDVVIPCVPIAAFEGLIKDMRGLLRADALVIDICSVKEHPVRVMKRLLPKSVQILGTHPTFGPDSAAESLRGRKLIVCKVRIDKERYGGIKKILERKGLEIVELSPRDHDRKMAASLVLTHFIGRALLDYGAKSTGVDTEGYQRLLRILQTVQNDSWQLFEDMNHYNAYAAVMRRRFLQSMRVIDRRVAA